MPYDPYGFDIDVDISPLLQGVEDPTLVSATWYQLRYNRTGRPAELQHKLERTFRNAMLHAQWKAASRRQLDRRRAVRAPLLSRVQVDGGSHLTACDISMSGLRCSGEPSAPVMDVEFKLPENPIPVDARVEVVSFKGANVLPLVGLRFAFIDPPYVDSIAAYVASKRDRMFQTA
jgi:hypothetical protein